MTTQSNATVDRQLLHLALGGSVARDDDVAREVWSDGIKIWPDPGMTLLQFRSRDLIGRRVSPFILAQVISTASGVPPEGTTAEYRTSLDAQGNVVGPRVWTPAVLRAGVAWWVVAHTGGAADADDVAEVLKPVPASGVKLWSPLRLRGAITGFAAVQADAAEVQKPLPAGGPKLWSPHWLRQAITTTAPTADWNGTGRSGVLNKPADGDGHEITSSADADRAKFRVWSGAVLRAAIINLVENESPVANWGIKPGDAGFATNRARVRNVPPVLREFPVDPITDLTATPADDDKFLVKDDRTWKTISYSRIKAAAGTTYSSGTQAEITGATNRDRVWTGKVLRDGIDARITNAAPGAGDSMEITSTTDPDKDKTRVWAGAELRGAIDSRIATRAPPTTSLPWGSITNKPVLSALTGNLPWGRISSKPSLSTLAGNLPWSRVSQKPSLASLSGNLPSDRVTGLPSLPTTGAASDISLSPSLTGSITTPTMVGGRTGNKLFSGRTIRAAINDLHTWARLQGKPTIPVIPSAGLPVYVTNPDNVVQMAMPGRVARMWSGANLNSAIRAVAPQSDWMQATTTHGAYIANVPRILRRIGAISQSLGPTPADNDLMLLRDSNVTAGMAGDWKTIPFSAAKGNIADITYSPTGGVEVSWTEATRTLNVDSSGLVDLINELR